MTPSVFRVFVQILIHLFNSFICASHGRRVRPRPVRVPPPLAGSRARQSAAAVDSDPAQLPDTVALPVRLRRNPRGVGIWGAGKYHWQRPSDTDRPPCKLVWFETLPDALDTTTAGIRWVAPCGWILLLHGSSYELCRVRLLPRMLLLTCFFFPRGRLQVRVQCFDRAGPPGTLMAKPREARLPTGEEVDEFFQKLEAEATFPAAALEQLAPPELVSLWKDIAATQSVAWPWVMLCELALASFLTPNARLHPLASFTVFSLTWTFFVHPGSCHTSNLLRLYQNVFHGIEKKVNRYRAEECARLRQQVQAGADGQALLKQRLAKLQPLALRLGTGSLEGIGLRMSQFPDWTATSGFLVEGLQFVQWLQAEFGLNRAIATQLWERMSWQRDVVNQGRSFDMTYPFLGVCGALHLEDVWPMFAQPDPLGLRGRLCFFLQPAGAQTSARD